MFQIESCPIPEDTLLNDYLNADTYTDCYLTNIQESVSQTRFVNAFYTTPVFKLERLILKVAASRPSTDIQAKQLATGASDVFAAWDVEARTDNQLLMSDYSRRTRSWLMAVPVTGSSHQYTRLYFGSAVVPVKNSKTGKLAPGWMFRALLGFHKLYSVVLLYAAKSRLQAQQRA
jgi:hypothetical protein